jgi:choline dehydrogenase-like flavoprotein
VRRFRRDELLPPQVAFVEACQESGFPWCADLNTPDVDGVGPIPLNNVEGIRWGTNLGYVDSARHRLNLTIRSNCVVQRILFDGHRATGLEVASGGSLQQVRGEAIVLCAGAIGTPHLLMLSGIGPDEQLRSAGVQPRQHLAGVGQNLRDHPHVGALWQPKTGYPMIPHLPRYQVALRYTAPGSTLRDDLQILMISYATNRVDRGGDGRTPVGIAIQPVLNLALSRGELQLRSADQSVQPAIDLNLLDHPADRQRLREGMRQAVQLGRHAAFSAIVGNRLGPDDEILESDDALDAWMGRHVMHTNHLCGTCKMGPPTDDGAVVDQRGRVHGVDGLRVADCSIMPDCIRANTNATAMMIGERMSDFIAEDLAGRG